MTRLDDAPTRKRTAQRGAEVVSVKAGDRIVGFSLPWDVPRPVNTGRKKKASRSSPKKKSASRAKK
jgi:hypothetical protein